jgi:lipopolysaccharide/colanic/teichoic acid biosynthesis glycosyltransferase
MAGNTTSYPSLGTYARQAHVRSGWDATQRVLDVMLIVAASPLWVPLLLLAVVLKLAIDGRPILFHHVRLGLNGRPFVLHKIRTTPPGFQAQPEDWSDEHFPPRTSFGRWLRRLDLDELPQFWNVIRGEMSLVGPRPEMPAHARTFSCGVPDYAVRLAVRPGLSGLAQIRGWRGNTCIHQPVLSDLEYLEKRGPANYFTILLKTLHVAWWRMPGIS